MCRRPPHTWLGTVAALGSLDLSDSSIGSDGPADVYAASVDLYNGFYQFRNRKLGSLFGIDFAERADVWGVSEIFDEERECFVP
eukprot:5608721-Pyramimonas_sp.AAC.1